MKIAIQSVVADLHLTEVRLQMLHMLWFTPCCPEEVCPLIVVLVVLGLLILLSDAVFSLTYKLLVLCLEPPVALVQD